MHTLILTNWVRFCGVGMLPDGSALTPEQATDLGVAEYQPDDVSADTLKDMHARFLNQQASLVVQYMITGRTDSLSCYIKCVTAWYLQNDAKEALKFLVELMRSSITLDTDAAEEVNVLARKSVDAIFDKPDMASILLEIDQVSDLSTYATALMSGIRTLAFMVPP